MKKKSLKQLLKDQTNSPMARRARESLYIVTAVHVGLITYEEAYGRSSEPQR